MLCKRCVLKVLQLSDNCCEGQTSWLNYNLVSSTLKSGFSPELQNSGLFFVKFVDTQKHKGVINAATINNELIGVTMDIQPIRTKTDYKNTLKEVSKLVELDPPLGSNDGDRLDILVTMVQAYEARHFSLDIPDPVDAIKFRMEQQGLKPKDLEPMIGRSNRVYEVLNRKRPLTLAMVRKLHAGLGISAECLINQ